MGRVIAISNLKGGIGKTTTVVNLGAGLALKGARVLLVDVDAQGNLALALGVRPRRTIYQVIIDGIAAADCIQNARPNLDLLAADQSLLGVQTIIAQRPDWSRVLEKNIRPLQSSYDFILIDSGGSLTLLNTNALVCATDVLVPTAIEHFSLKGIDLLIEHVTRIKGHSGSIRMIIPTMFDPRVRQSGELLTQLQAKFGKLVSDPIRINVRLSESPATGRTIYEYDPRSRGAADYAQLVEHVSDVFGFKPARQPEPVQGSAPATIPQPGAAPPAAAPQPAPSAQIASAASPFASASASAGCPNCGRPLQYATLAGYRVGYCENCKYKTQTLISRPRH